MKPRKVRAVTTQIDIAKCREAVSSYCKLSLFSDLLKKKDIGAKKINYTRKFEV